MKSNFLIVLLASGLLACNDSGTTISVKGDAIGPELDTLGEKIEDKAERVGDSVEVTYKEVKSRVKAGIDSVRARRRDTTD